jgi:hypothetical protein
MPRGGARPGSGPKKGTRYRKRLQLTGQPVERAGGTPPHLRMRAQRRRVALLVYDGMTPEKIAAVMGTSLEKLQVIFARELEHGAALIRAELLENLKAAGDDGNVSANRALQGMPPALDLRASLPKAGARAAREPNFPAGKKATADLLAQNAEVGTPFEGLLGGEESNGGKSIQ